MAGQIKRIKNRKNVSVNKRNRKFNLFYLSTVRTLNKKLIMFVEVYPDKISKQELIGTFNLLISKLDKAVKKNVIHKNTAAKRKSKILHLLKLNQINPFV